MVQVLLNLLNDTDFGMKKTQSVLKNDKIIGKFPIHNMDELLQVEGHIQEDKEFENQLVGILSECKIPSKLKHV